MLLLVHKSNMNVILRKKIMNVTLSKCLLKIIALHDTPHPLVWSPYNRISQACCQLNHRTCTCLNVFPQSVFTDAHNFIIHVQCTCS